MAGFDITSILDFKPPKFVCPACRGLFHSFHYDKSRREDQFSCPVCRIRFVYANDDPWQTESVPNLHTWFRDKKYVIDHGQNLFEHGRGLAEIVKESQGDMPWCDPWPAMRLLFEVLSRARSFVHFASWGISHLLTGALKVTSIRVPVYGVVSNVEDFTRVELTEFPTEAPKFNVQVVPTGQANFDAPHQKLVVVDGLLAFKGSMNLTNAAMRKADRGLDILEVVTDFQQVTELNNKYFAPVWKNATQAEKVEYSYSFLPF